MLAISQHIAVFSVVILISFVILFEAINVHICVYIGEIENPIFIYIHTCVYIRKSKNPIFIYTHTGMCIYSKSVLAAAGAASGALAP